MWKMILIIYMAGSISVDACHRPVAGVYDESRATRTASIQSIFLPERKKDEGRLSYVKRVAEFVKTFQQKTLSVSFTGGRMPNGTDTSNMRHSLYMSYLRALYGLYDKLDEDEKKDGALVKALRSLRVIP